MRILVADDDPSIRTILDLSIKKLGHEATLVENGREAWDEHRRNAYPLIICDWMMPLLSGPELCRAIRAVSQEQYTSFIILTALNSKSNFVEAFNAGADDFMTKPVDMDELKARVGVAERIVNLHSRVTMLEGLLSICAYCKKIRDENSSWQHVERYIASRAAVNFSHAICPHCKEKAIR